MEQLSTAQYNLLKTIDSLLEQGWIYNPFSLRWINDLTREKHSGGSIKALVDYGYLKCVQKNGIGYYNRTCKKNEYFDWTQ